ncbi:MAG: hypothetical protein GXC73_02185 [Chitinophagaceae bacterium]|nr:hypothetical protein [Chitinophagaceae bacterium]
MIEVFKTNVPDISAKECLLHFLQQLFPACRISLDLHDCDKVLRFEGKNIQPETIIQIVSEKGFYCCKLE